LVDNALGLHRCASSGTAEPVGRCLIGARLPLMTAADKNTSTTPHFV